MKKILITSLIAALAFGGNAEARQIIDRTNNFFINLPDRFLLDTRPDTDNKYVVLNAYDPEDEATFVIKISPSQISEINGLALDNERSKFRNSLMKMGLEPYVEGILHMFPNHESIYTFSKMEDQGEVLNYLMAKFWAHNKEYSFFCIQPTKTLKTQEFLDSIDSFICLHHQNYTLPYPQKKERPEYDKARDEHNDLVKKADLNAKKLLAEGKDEEAKKLLDSLPEFTEKPTEYIPMVEINGMKPLPADITDKTAHDALYSEHPEQVWAKARTSVPKDIVPNRQSIQAEPAVAPEDNIPSQKNIQTGPTIPEDRVDAPTHITPPPIKRGNQGVTVIRDGRATVEYNFKPEPKLEPEHKPTKEELKQIERMKKEKEKFEKEQAKRQAKLEKLRKKEEEKEKKRLEKERKRKKEQE